MKHARLPALFVLLLIALPALPMEMAPVMEADAVIVNCEIQCAEQSTFNISSPAYVYITITWFDGGTRYSNVELGQVALQVETNSGSGTDFYIASTNPLPVHPSQTFTLYLFPLNNVTTPLWQRTLTAGAAGSVMVQHLVVDIGVFTRARLLPMELLYRPYDVATGAGLPIEQFNITVEFPNQIIGPSYYNGTRGEFPIAFGQIETFYGINITTRVRDYFGNLLYNQTRLYSWNTSNNCQIALGNPGGWPSGSCSPFTSNFETWDIPLSVYSVKFYNQKPDQFVKFGLHWNGTGAGEEVFSPNGLLEPSWWNSQWAYRNRIRVQANATVPDGYIFNMTLAGADYVASGKMQADYRDLRVVYWNGTGWTEAPRVYNGTILRWEQQETVLRNETTPAIAAWKFDDGSGLSATDSSGNGLTGTLTSGPTWTNGIFGSAIQFDGTNDYVSVADTASLTLGSAFTLEAWINTESLAKQQGIFEKYKDTSCGSPCGGYGFRLTSAGKLFGFTVDGGGAATTLTGVTTVSPGIWHHVGYVWTGTTHTLYLDGASDATGANTRVPNDHANTLKIGARGDDASNTFQGKIDEPRIYTGERSAAQFACDYRPKYCTAISANTVSRDYWIYYGNAIATTAPSISNYSFVDEVMGNVPEAYWRFNEGTGTSAADSADSHTGTLNGVVWTTSGWHEGDVSFDGANDFITAPDDANLDFGSGVDFTLEAWINTTQVIGASNYPQIYSKQDSPSGGPTRTGYLFFFNGDSSGRLSCSIVVANTFYTVMDTGPMNDGKWHHVICLRRGATLEYWKDGQMIVSGAAVTTSLANSDNLQFGRQSNNLYFYGGHLDASSIYRSALTATQITTKYNASINHPTLNSTDNAWATLDSDLGFEWFQSPGETVERFLNPGYYTLHVITDNRTGVRSYASLGLNISEANYVMVSGLNITRFVGDFVTITNNQVILSNQLRPDVVHYGEILPSAPTILNSPPLNSDFILIHPFSILTGTTSYTGGTGPNQTLYQPSLQSDSGDGSLLTTMTVTKDTFVFSGSTTAHVWINYSNGTTIWENGTLPTSVTLPGISADVTVESNQSITTQRISDFRAVWEFSFRYYPTSKRYEQSLTLNNTMNRTVLNPQWFVGFPENRSINISGAMVQDSNNLVWLTMGRHYTTTQAGYYMDFDVLNSSTSRAFFFQFYDLNATEGFSVPVVVISSIERALDFQGSNSYWVGTGTFANPFTSSYGGEIILKLQCPECEDVLVNSIVVVDATNGRQLDPSEYYTSGTDIHVVASAVGTVPLGGARDYDVYFKLVLDPSTQDFDIFAPIGGTPISLFFIGIIAEVALIAVAIRGGSAKVQMGGFVGAVTLGAILLILFIVHDLQGAVL